MNETSLGRALKRPDIAQYLESQKALLALNAEQIKARGKSMALLVGLELMHNAKSEAVRARMVEFFAGERPAGPQFNLNINQNAGQGYVYPRPGQVVEIIDGNATSPDSQSDADDS